MYRYICTDHTIEVIWQYFIEYEDIIPEGTPKEFIIELLKKIMRNNMLQFCNTYWRQQTGTTMGTSYAMNYVNFYIVFLEMTQTLNNNKFNNSPLFFRQFIDDRIVVSFP